LQGDGPRVAVAARLTRDLDLRARALRNLADSLAASPDDRTEPTDRNLHHSHILEASKARRACHDLFHQANRVRHAVGRSGDGDFAAVGPHRVDLHVGGGEPLDLGDRGAAGANHRADQLVRYPHHVRRRTHWNAWRVCGTHWPSLLLTIHVNDHLRCGLWFVTRGALYYYAVQK